MGGRVSPGGGVFPRWRRDGREIVYLTPVDQLMAVDVDGTKSEFRIGAVEPLFRLSPTGQRSRYDVSADGQRFIVNYSPEAASQQPITVIVNWTAELKR